MSCGTRARQPIRSPRIHTRAPVETRQQTGHYVFHSPESALLLFKEWILLHSTPSKKEGGTVPRANPFFHNAANPATCPNQGAAAGRTPGSSGMA